MEDFPRLGELEVPNKDMPSEAGKPSSSPRPVRQFPTMSVDPDRKRTIILIVPKNARVLSAPLGIDNYLRYLGTEEDQEKLNEVGTSCLFNEAQHALNWVRHQYSLLNSTKLRHLLLFSLFCRPRYFTMRASSENALNSASSSLSLRSKPRKRICSSSSVSNRMGPSRIFRLS